MNKQILILLCFCLTYLGCTEDVGQCRLVGQEGDTGQGQGGGPITTGFGGGFGADPDPQPQDADPASPCAGMQLVICTAHYADNSYEDFRIRAFDISEGRSLCEQSSGPKGQPTSCDNCRWAVTGQTQWKCKGTVEPCLHTESDKEDSCYFNETVDYPSDPTNDLIIACEQELAETHGGSWVCAKGSLTCTSLGSNSP